MRTLLIDNHDSFTYNLFQLLAEVNGEEPIVVRNDEAGWDQLSRLQFDNVVLSPGPGHPGRERDFGVCAEAIRSCEVPLLGVCLGHQGLSHVHGGEIVVTEPMHGRIGTVRHRGAPLFAGIPAEFRAVRYHSLHAGTPLPRELEPIAWAEDGTLMALGHRRRRQWGLQFHPESVCSEYGGRLLANFRDLTATTVRRDRSRAPAVLARGRLRRERSHRPDLELRVRRLDRPVEAERAFVGLFGDSDPAFWLDSSRPGESARFSYMGDATGPLAATISYRLGAGALRVERRRTAEVRAESVFDYLARESARLRSAGEGLPFDFKGGFVGYLGYELKADCGGERAHESSLPDAALLFADRVVVLDHRERKTYLLCVCERGSGGEAERWFDETERRLDTLPLLSPPAMTAASRVALARSRRRYLRDIAVCGERLREGETYEVCLTNKIRLEGCFETLDLYRRLRAANPSPFAAFLRFGAVAVLSSSPERFLRVDPDGAVEARPIKGTIGRGRDAAEDIRRVAELRGSEKNRAENLMITDLLRNDLGSVCAVGSVSVPGLMDVETHGTVHHLVSTVRGRLRPGLGAVDCVRACFPGGSMTGAPKKRTMEIIDELEGEARGVYAGAIGYFGVDGGCDLSIAIRAIVVDGERATIGVGGAIVSQSEPEDEYQESLLKGLAPIRAIDPRIDLHSLFDR